MRTGRWSGRIAPRVGRLLGANPRGAGAFEIDVQTRVDGGAVLVWNKRADWHDWANLSEGCYLLRTNSHDWPPQELWRAYIQLTQSIFRSMKSLLETRPIYHRCDETIRGHVFCSFLALVLRKALQDRLAERGLTLEWAHVLRDLDRLRQFTIRSGETHCTLRSPTVGVAGHVLQAVGIALGPPVRFTEHPEATEVAESVVPRPSRAHATADSAESCEIMV